MPLPGPPDSLGDRMKGYEAAETERRFLPMLPVYARLDGRCFSSFTAGMDRPYDVRMSRAMIETTRALVDKAVARCGYTQSDEISLVWLADEPTSEMFFSGKIQKMCSVLAGMAAAMFGKIAMVEWPERCAKAAPIFDCRVFQLPSRTEAANAFLWREQDATKNAISMAAGHYYSHKQLHKKTGPEKQEMLFQAGVNFNDYPSFFKRGTFIQRRKTLRELTAEELAVIPEKYRPTGPIERGAVLDLDMPPFGKVANREAVIFDGAVPERFAKAA